MDEKKVQAIMNLIIYGGDGKVLGGGDSSGKRREF